jgi:hypothetical protein
MITETFQKGSWIEPIALISGPALKISVDQNPLVSNSMGATPEMDGAAKKSHRSRLVLADSLRLSLQLSRLFNTRPDIAPSSLIR